MFNFNNTLSIPQLSNAIDKDENDIKEKLNNLEENPPISTLLKILMAIGAFISLSFFLPFFILSFISNAHMSYLVSGIVLMVIALALFYANKEKQERLSIIYLLQLSSLMMILGKSLFVFGAAGILANQTNFYNFNFNYIAMVSCFVSATSYFFYNVSFEKAASCFISILLVFFALIEYGNQTYNHFYMVLALIIALFALWFYYSYSSKRPASLLPLVQAAIASLIVITLTIFKHNIYLMNFMNFNSYLYLKAIYGGALCLTTFLIFRDRLKENLEHTVFAAIALAAISWFAPAGVCLSLIMLLIGYDKWNKALIAVGIALLSAFLIEYYYSLSLNLVDKSILLATTGAILLVCAFYIHLRGAKS